MLARVAVVVRVKIFSRSSTSAGGGEGRDAFRAACSCIVFHFGSKLIVTSKEGKDNCFTTSST